MNKPKKAETPKAQIKKLYEDAKKKYYNLIEAQRMWKLHDTIDTALPEKKSRIQQRIKLQFFIKIRNATTLWEEAIKKLNKADKSKDKEEVMKLFREVHK